MGEEFSSKLLCPRPDNRISAAVVNAEQASLEKEVIEPFGLGGWSWGVLRLHDVAIDPATELIGRAGDGIGVFRRHFAQFRPLVTATALGTAAGVHTLVAETLAARTRVGMLPKVVDHALVIIGRTHAGDHRGSTVDHYHSPACGAGTPHADFAARVGKASGVDTAVKVVAELGPLIGAAGFQKAHPLAKARGDLTGLLYADGIHDSLYRSGTTVLPISSFVSRMAACRGDSLASTHPPTISQ